MSLIDQCREIARTKNAPLGSLYKLELHEGEIQDRWIASDSDGCVETLPAPKDVLEFEHWMNEWIDSILDTKKDRANEN